MRDDKKCVFSKGNNKVVPRIPTYLIFCRLYRHIIYVRGVCGPVPNAPPQQDFSFAGGKAVRFRGVSVAHVCALPAEWWMYRLYFFWDMIFVVGIHNKAVQRVRLTVDTRNNV